MKKRFLYFLWLILPTLYSACAQNNVALEAHLWSKYYHTIEDQRICLLSRFDSYVQASENQQNALDSFIQRIGKSLDTLPTECNLIYRLDQAQKALGLCQGEKLKSDLQIQSQKVCIATSQSVIATQQKALDHAKHILETIEEVNKRAAESTATITQQKATIASLNTLLEQRYSLTTVVGCTVTTGILVALALNFNKIKDFGKKLWKGR